MKLINYIIKNRIKSPTKIAYACNDEYLTYEELYERIKKISFNLKKINLKKGDIIAIIYYNSIIYPQIFYSAANLDLSIAPLNPSLSKEDIINQLNKLNVKYLFSWNAYLKGLNFKKMKLKKKNCVDLDSSSKIFKNFSEFLVKPKTDYILKINTTSSKSNFLLGLTSGSTSEPKVTIFSQHIKILRSQHARKIYKLSDKEVILISTPLYHSISFRLLVLPIILNSTCIILNKFTIKNWFNTIFKWKITFSILVSDQIEMISSKLNKNNLKKINSLRTFVSCCSPLKYKIKNKLINNSNFEIYDTYGASEVGTITNINLKKEINKINSNGKVTRDYNVFIYKNSKLTKLNNVEGEICCKTKNIFSGYYNLRSKTKIEPKNNTIFYTGDIGYFDQDRYLYVTGRKKDIIIRGGINVYPLDVEKILNIYPNIIESAVIGIQVKNLGEMIYAFIKLKLNKKIESKKLYKHCLNKLADYQIPSKCFVVNDFPRATLNKISKYQLKNNLHKYANKKNIIFDSYSLLI